MVVDGFAAWGIGDVVSEGGVGCWSSGCTGLAWMGMGMGMGVV